MPKAPKTQYPPRKIVSVVFFGFLLLVALYSVQNPKELSLTPANTSEVVHYLQGTVVDERNMPVSGARVAVSDSFATTNVDGKFTLSLMPTSYTVSISKNNYQTVTKVIDLRGQKQIQVTFTLVQ